MLASITSLVSTRLSEMAVAFTTAMPAMAGMFAFLIPLFVSPLGKAEESMFLWVIYYLLPNWHHLTFGSETAEITTYWVWMILYAFLFSGFYLFMACCSFTHKDIQ